VTTAAPIFRAVKSAAASAKVRCGWVVTTSLPLAARMRATVIVASLKIFLIVY
jgi:hypothetical protein